MATHSPQIYQTEQIRELELLARQRYAIAGNEMMIRAGHAAFNFLIKRWPNTKTIAVFCGAGNNGGDGYVLAQAAHEHGVKVSIWQVGDPAKLSIDARTALEACKKAGLFIRPFEDQTNWYGANVIVDALCGIGLQGDVRREIRYVIELINKSKIPVLAIDVPSGINADTGAVLGVAIKASATITFIGMKLGLVSGSGVGYAGEVYCDDLKLPQEIFSLTQGVLQELSLAQFSHYLKPRPRDMNKGDAGHVLVVGGDAGHGGAARMAAQAALRVGAGLVTVATHPKHSAILNATLPEVMCSGVWNGRSLGALIKKADVIVIGPGLGQSLWSKALLRKVLASNLPLIVDADALNLLAKKPSARTNWILTPHPGEAARLLGITNKDVQADRLNAIQQLQHRYNGVCLLKGAGTLVLAPHTAAAICEAGNPGMATGGMGDVLSGVIGGLVAQGIPLADAAKLGVCLHANAGDLAAAQGGERGLIATDLMPYLRKLVNP
jgi:ADP-dependent NAD(P)H-hydrate dehydratase / NAD(P)H-hydrate epimerase